VKSGVIGRKRDWPNTTIRFLHQVESSNRLICRLCKSGQAKAFGCSLEPVGISDVQ